MQKINAVVRLELGHIHDATELTPTDVRLLLAAVPIESQNPKTLSITYTDIDTGLVVKEHHFNEEGQEV
jgi:hypothetical protein